MDDDAVKLVEDWVKWVKKVKYKVGRKLTWADRKPNAVKIVSPNGRSVNDFNQINFSNNGWSLYKYSHEHCVWVPKSLKDSPSGYVVVITDDNIEIHYYAAWGDHYPWCWCRPAQTSSKSVDFCSEPKIPEELRKPPQEWFTMKNFLDNEATEEQDADLIKASKYIASKGVSFKSPDDLLEFVTRIRSFCEWGYNSRSWPVALDFVLIQ